VYEITEELQDYFIKLPIGAGFVLKYLKITWRGFRAENAGLPSTLYWSVSGARKLFIPTIPTWLVGIKCFLPHE